jgi:hypothetical protein
MHNALVPGPSLAAYNSGWTISSDNEIGYKKGFQISIKGNTIYAQNCATGGHPDGKTFTPVKAYAVYE